MDRKRTGNVPYIGSMHVHHQPKALEKIKNLLRVRGGDFPDTPLSLQREPAESY